MDQNQDELQQAINNITNNGGGAAGATDVVSQVANKVSADLGTPAAPAVPANAASRQRSARWHRTRNVW